MNFAYGPADEQLRDALTAVFAEHPAPERLRACADAGAEPFDADLWAALTAVLAPEVSRRDAAALRLGATVAAQCAGSALAPVPLVGALLLVGAGITQRFERLAWALGAPGGADAGLVLAGGRVSGVLAVVADGLVADALLTTVGPDAVLVDLTAPGVRRTALSALDLAHHGARLELAEVPVRRWPGVAASVAAQAAILTAFEQLGGAQRCLDLAVAYAKERIAFGQPIGAFQAVKHELAKLHVEIELARSNAWFGAWALAQEAPELAQAACLARVAATEVYTRAAQECIHLHGAVGFTWAHEGHLHLRRARALEAVLGNAAAWRECLLSQPGAVAGF